jgi:hypothetical protein
MPTDDEPTLPPNEDLTVDVMAKFFAAQIKMANLEGKLEIALKWIEALTRTVGEAPHEPPPGGMR